MMAAELMKEARILEYWRKRYLGQAGVVGVLALIAAGTAWKCADFMISKVFVSLFAFFIFYIMYKALRESLQARGEGLILAKGNEIFGEVMFDVGRGLCENALLTQEVISDYQVRECDNVMRGKGYWLEEDWFYSVISSRYIPLNQTVFKGVILAFADISGEDGLKGAVMVQNNKTIVTGAVAERLKQKEAVEIIVAFMRLFKADEAKLVVADKTLYVWIKTEDELFYQFSLFRPNSLAFFQTRIHRLKELSEKMLHALNG